MEGAEGEVEKGEREEGREGREVPLKFPKWRVILTMTWQGSSGWEMTRLIKLRTLGVGGCTVRFGMPGMTLVGPVEVVSVRNVNHFFGAPSGTVLDDGGRGGTAPHWVVWPAGSLPLRRRIILAVKDRAWLHGSHDIWAAERGFCRTCQALAILSGTGLPEEGILGAGEREERGLEGVLLGAACHV